MGFDFSFEQQLKELSNFIIEFVFYSTFEKKTNCQPKSNNRAADFVGVSRRGQPYEYSTGELNIKPTLIKLGGVILFFFFCSAL